METPNTEQEFEEHYTDRITKSLQQCHEEYPESGNANTIVEYTVLGDK